MHLKNLAIAILLLSLAACSRGGSQPISTPLQGAGPTAVNSTQSRVIETPTPTIMPTRLLSICLIREPRSLFLYNALSASEQSVLAAIYDGPIDVKKYTPKPVILVDIPSLDGGSALLAPVPVSLGDLIVDAQGNLANLEEGVVYRPSGCNEQACNQVFTGTESVQIDQLVLNFKLLPGLQWSDGKPLTSADSVYSYEVARGLYPSALPDLVNRTASYTSLDEQTVEWVGIPGYVDGLYQTKFFSPLPQHAWSGIPVGELPGAEASSRKPLGWGAYVIDEWIAGDHITLHANPLYFRAGEGLPYFDDLVFRFVADSREAQSAILAGECDLVDQAQGQDADTASWFDLRDEGSVSLVFQTATAWDVLEFGVDPLAEDRPPYFASAQVRQAVAMCIDRQALVAQLSGGQMQVADLYVHPLHPLYNPQARQYVFDPAAAADLLNTSGWVDHDNAPSTPRTAQGVAGIADGTPFVVQYLVPNDEEHQQVARLVQANLEQCGIQADIAALPVEQFLAAGPDGPIFGRQFDLAQFAWMGSVEPPCSLYLTSEISGQYPDSPKGWGGVNASGYSNPQYDQACLDALFSLAGTDLHVEKHALAQSIFAEDLPALPFYWHYKLFASRPDMCGLPAELVTESIFTDLELFDYGEHCP